MKTACKVLGFGTALAAFAGPAWAAPVAIPEPGSFSLFAAGGVSLLGIYAYRKWMKRK